MTSIVECSDALASTQHPETDPAWITPICLTPLPEIPRAALIGPNPGLEKAITPGQQSLEIRQPPHLGQSIGITAIVPVYNERNAVSATIEDLQETLRGLSARFEIIIVDDGSTDGTSSVLNVYEGRPDIRILRNDRNRGYGYSIKRAVSIAEFETIIITDADGTYPIARIKELLVEAESADMVVGSRNGAAVAVPLIRRPAKWVLRKLAEYLTSTNIPDLNSGLRIMKRGLIQRFMPLLPNGFSFTTTITLASLTHDYNVKYLPINYAKRTGRSSIRPVRDTLNFLSLIVRTVLYFRPLKVFVPISVLLMAAAVGVALVSKLMFGQLADVTTVTLAAAAFQTLAIGLLADLIEKRSPAYSNIAVRHQTAGSRQVARIPLPAREVTELRTVSVARDHVKPLSGFDPRLWTRQDETEPSRGYAFAGEPADPFLESRRSV